MSPTPETPGSGSNSLLALLPDKGEWVVLRVPYPLSSTGGVVAQATASNGNIITQTERWGVVASTNILDMAEYLSLRCL